MISALPLIFILFCNTLFLFFSSLGSLLLSLSAFNNSVSHSAGNKFYGTYSVIVSGNNVIDIVGIAVCINYSNDRNAKLFSFRNSDLFLTRVNHEQRSGKLSSPRRPDATR